MALSTKRLKYLDLTNYLAAGTSLDGFYKAYNVPTTKGHFPYEWFTSLDKLNCTELPPQTEFFSSLKNSGIDDATYQSCLDVWKEQGMKTFADYLSYYNIHDTVGLVQGIEKMLAVENDQGLDVFKESVSLPSLTKKYLLNKLSPEDYFTGISEKHQHIHKDLIMHGKVGGPSLIFHRYHEAYVTKIRGKNLCKKIIGYDANSLYLYCVGQDMCMGYYSLREKKNGYKRDTNFSKEAIQWMEYLSQTHNIFPAIFSFFKRGA